ncbi:unnamed protein product, partial [Brachionus calyciflorus]
MWRPVAYWSKRFTRAQRKYSAAERELLAIVMAIEHFKSYLFGKVVTDHKPFIWFKNLKDPAPRLPRWLIELRLYEFDIEYRQGHENGNADALSRWLLEEEESETETDPDPGFLVNKVILQEVEFNENQLEDEALAVLYSWVREGVRPVQCDKTDPELYVYWCQFKRFRIFGKNVYRNYDKEYDGIHFQYVVPRGDREVVLKKIHDDPLGGHLGQCEQCALVKAPKVYTKQPIVPIRTSRPFLMITWDILGPLPTTETERLYILVIVCHFSKSQKTEEVANCLLEYICKHGLPEAALSDRGTNFQSELMNQVFDVLDIQRLRTSAYHPQCDCETERFNRTLEQMLACYVADNQKEWDQHLPKMAFAYNTAVHTTTGVTPFEVVYGRRPKLPVDLMFPCPGLDVNLDVESYAQKIRTDLLKYYETVARNSDSKEWVWRNGGQQRRGLLRCRFVERRTTPIIFMAMVEVHQNQWLLEMVRTTPFDGQLMVC